MLRARDFVLVASSFITRRHREAGSEIRRALLILDVVSSEQVKYVWKERGVKEF